MTDACPLQSNGHANTCGDGDAFDRRQLLVVVAGPGTGTDATKRYVGAILSTSTLRAPPCLHERNGCGLQAESRRPGGSVLPVQSLSGTRPYRGQAELRERCAQRGVVGAQDLAASRGTALGTYARAKGKGKAKGGVARRRGARVCGLACGGSQISWGGRATRTRITAPLCDTRDTGRGRGGRRPGPGARRAANRLRIRP